MGGNSYHNQPTVTAFNNITLTATFPGNRYVIPSEGMQKLSLDFRYNAGATETLNVLEMQLEHSPDNGVTWFSLVIDTTGAASVLSQRVWQMAQDLNYNVIIDINYKLMRLSLRETGVVTNAGTATVFATLGGL